MAVAISAYFITRSLLGRSATCRKPWAGCHGDLSERVPVTSNDAVGERPASSTTGRGLRERERFRETFGACRRERAATILPREGEGVWPRDA